MTSEGAVKSKAGFGLLAWRALLILAAGFLAWRIIVLGLSSQGLEQLKEGDTAAAERVLSLLPRHPEALYRQALALLPTNAIGAEAQLAEAYRRDPTQARPLLALAELALTRDEAERADALVTQAVKLEPAEAMIHRRAAIYWLKRGQMERGLQHLSLALVARPQAHQDLLDIFMRIAEDHTTRMALGPLAQDPPAWWPSFFERLAQRALDVETVRFVYGLRTRASRTPVTPEERQAYLQRLLKDGLIAEAYLTWVNGLTTAERGHMGLLHNGGFELPLGKAGFDWRSIPHRQVVARTAATFGVGGERALPMVFRNQEGAFHHLRQSLFLDPGTYRLSGKVRSESLASQGGLRWTLRCLQPREAVLGESERFLGSEKWRGFRVDFEVPEDCRLQEIRLESAGKRDFEQRISGEIWFDDLAIRRSTGLTAAARADELARGRDAMTGAEGEGEGEKAVNGSDGSGEDSRPGQEGQAEDHKDVQDGSEGPRL
jgi:tetratricopeptide (TPR) repeat protein